MPIYYAEPQVAIPDSKLLYKNANLLLRWTTNSDSRFQTLAPKCQIFTLSCQTYSYTNSDSRFQTLAPKCQSITLNQNSDSRFDSLCWIVQTILPHAQRFPIPNSYTELPNYIVTQIAITDSKLLHWIAKLCCCANSDSWMLETLILDSKLLTVILGKVHSLFFTLTYGTSLLLEMSQLYLKHGNLSCWIERIDCRS